MFAIYNDLHDPTVRKMSSIITGAVFTVGSGYMLVLLLEAEGGVRIARPFLYFCSCNWWREGGSGGREAADIHCFRTYILVLLFGKGGREGGWH